MADVNASTFPGNNRGDKIVVVEGGQTGQNTDLPPEHKDSVDNAGDI